MTAEAEFKIYESLCKHLAAATGIENFDTKYIPLYIAPFGSMNYNLYEFGKSDVDSQLIVIPTSKQLFWEIPKRKRIQVNNKEYCTIVDIREFVKGLLNSNLNEIELLFSQYEKVLDIRLAVNFHKTFIQTREEIAYYNKEAFLLRAFAIAQNNLFKKAADSKSIAIAVRLLYTMQKYFNDEPFSSCLEVTDKERDEILAIKHSDKIESSYISSIYEQLESYYHKVKDNYTFAKKEDVGTKLKKNTESLLHKVLNNEVNLQK